MHSFIHCANPPACLVLHNTTNGKNNGVCVCVCT